MSKFQRPKLKEARSPGSIVNSQHHDASLAGRHAAGSPGTVEKIISNAATAQPIKDYCVIRVLNVNAATQFLFIGAEADVPVGAPTIATGIAIPSNAYENFYIGKLEGNESIFIKASSNDIQVVVFE